MLDKRIYAAEISVSNKDQTLTIDWADDHHSVYGLDGLRRACPCVQCAGGHAHMGRPADPTIFDVPPSQTWTISNVQEMGNYAMQIFWADGHNDGIYQWRYLRDLCPCESCRAKAS
ncbi:MAG: DUF971 domain-containing protein [Calditrichaeota bacterium]|nr:DUF971 domain-containing protein [candidate division KSB1 bacterium]MCZ6818582.1 DUF971 domain-containing protein [Calditrichota bacterium]